MERNNKVMIGISLKLNYVISEISTKEKGTIELIQWFVTNHSVPNVCVNKTFVTLRVKTKRLKEFHSLI